MLPSFAPIPRRLHNRGLQDINTPTTISQEGEFSLVDQNLSSVVLTHRNVFLCQDNSAGRIQVIGDENVLLVGRNVGQIELTGNFNHVWVTKDTGPLNEGIRDLGRGNFIHYIAKRPSVSQSVSHLILEDEFRDLPEVPDESENVQVMRTMFQRNQSASMSGSSYIRPNVLRAGRIVGSNPSRPQSSHYSEASVTQDPTIEHYSLRERPMTVMGVRDVQAHFNPYGLRQFESEFGIYRFRGEGQNNSEASIMQRVDPNRSSDITPQQRRILNSTSPGFLRMDSMVDPEDARNHFNPVNEEDSSWASSMMSEPPHDVDVIDIDSRPRAENYHCPICQEVDCKSKPGSAYLDCMHWYHYDCVEAWIKSGKTCCPLCKNDTYHVYKITGGT